MTPERGPADRGHWTPDERPGQDALPEDEARVRDLLRAAADVGPMPADVVARLDAALAQAAATTPRTTTPVASLDARRRSRVRRFQQVFATAAGIAVVVGGGIALGSVNPDGGASTGGSGGSADSAASALAGDLPATATLLRSGKDFSNVAAVQDVAQDVVAGEDAAGGGAVAESEPDGAGGSGDDRSKDLLGAPATPPPGVTLSDDATPAEDQRGVAERAVGCTGVDPASVVRVEIATWRTEPAALVVHRTGEGVEALVVALDCSPGEAVLSRVEVDAG